MPTQSTPVAVESTTQTTEEAVSHKEAHQAVEPQTQPVGESERHCANCGHPLEGPFCGMCGQPEKSAIRFFGSVVAHFLNDIFGWDSRAGRTLFPLLFRPGFLTNEYIRGRRVHYVPPLRLYLFVSIVFFLVLGLVTDDSVKDLVKLQQSNSVEFRLVNSEIEKLKEKMAASDYQVNEQDKARLQDLREQRQSVRAKMDQDIADLQKQIDEIRSRQAKPGYQIPMDEKIKLDTFESTIGMLKDSIADAEPEPSQPRPEGKNAEVSGDKQAATEGHIPFGISVKTDKPGLDIDFGQGIDFLSAEQNRRLVAFLKQLETKLEAALRKDAGPLIKQILAVLPQTMFVLLPLFALLLKLYYPFSKRFYMEHLTVALHSHAFIFFNLLLVSLLSALHEQAKHYLPSAAAWIEPMIQLLILWVPIYLFFMQKRVYGQGFIVTVFKFSLVGMSYLVLLMFTIAIAFIWGLAKL